MLRRDSRVAGGTGATPLYGYKAARQYGTHLTMSVYSRDIFLTRYISVPTSTQSPTATEEKVQKGQ